MLANANLAGAKSIGQPASNHRHHPLMVADVRFVYAWHGGVAYFVGNDAKQVAFKRLRVEVNDPAAKIRHAFAQFPRRRTLHLNGPPFTIELEAQRWPFAAPAWGRGGLFHAT
jgi:hypothetical protein